jgi:hypothetical protein
VTKTVSVAASVQSVGKLFSSLFGSAASATPPKAPPPPPPLPPSPARPPARSGHASGDAAAAYWQGSGSEHAVVVRKAKVRDGVEIDTAGRSAAGTLEEGAVVVVLAHETAKDGTPRTRVRSRLMDTSATKPLVVGWVSAKLLRPYRPAKSPPDLDAGGPAAADGGTSAALGGEAEPSLESVEYEAGAGPVHRLLESVADFMAQTVYLVKDACEGDLVRIVRRFDASESGAGAAVTADELEGVLDSGVWRQVEAEVFVPLKARLEAAVAREVVAEASFASAKLRALKALPQAFWSIPLKHQSPSAFNAAVVHLNAIPKACLPSDKVDLLLLAVTTAERLCDDEHPLPQPTPSPPQEPDLLTGETPPVPAQREERAPLGADDLFPIFVYVLVQSDLWKSGGLVVLRELLSGLANPERQRWSASAYYVATLEAAIEHIKAT